MRNRNGSATSLDLDPIALHLENNRKLERSDILVPAYPGSGHALLGNILLELGLNYSDPYTERFGANGQSTAVDERTSYRQRLAATARRDKTGNTTARPRFVKTHLYPDGFVSIPYGIILLVRDPRDAMYSYFNWRLSFSEEGETGPFLEFLNRVGHNDCPPAADWTLFQKAWMGQEVSVKRFHVVRFEDIKRNPMTALTPIIADFAPHTRTNDLLSAIEASRFEVMQAHETKLAQGASSKKIMRRGMVEEWRSWFDPTFAALLSDPSLRQVAGNLGYLDWEPRVIP